MLYTAHGQLHGHFLERITSGHHQIALRFSSGVEKTPLQLVENKELADAKMGSLAVSP